MEDFTLSWQCAICGQIPVDNEYPNKPCGNCGGRCVTFGTHLEAQHQQHKFQTFQQEGPKKDDCQYNSTAICPYCGREVSTEEIHGDGDEYDGWCDHCEKEFTIITHVSISYTTMREEW